MKLFMNIQSGISFKNPDPFSPRKDAKSNLKCLQNRGFSGPIIPEARRNNKFHQNRGFSGPLILEARRNNKFDDDNAKEPTSPKISCMGQIKHKKKMIIKDKKKTKTTPLPKQENPFSREHPGSGFWTSRTVQDSGRPIINDTEEKGKRRRRHNSQIMFGSTAKSTGIEPDVSGESRVGDAGVPPRLGQLKKFESGHDTLSKIDWATALEEGREKHEVEVLIPFSAPILMERVKPVILLPKKKEINLWKRRTMAQPQPLHLK